MDKNEIIPLLWFMPTFAWMTASKYLFQPPFDAIAGSLGFVIMIFGLVGHDIWARSIVDSYPHWRAFVVPMFRFQDFFFTHYERSIPTAWDDEGKAIRFITPMHLGFIFKHPIYGKINRIYVRHNLPISRRIKLRRGKAQSMGILVDHPQTDYPYLYEYPVPHIDHAKKYPIYELVIGLGDYPTIAELIKQHHTVIPKDYLEIEV